nr:T-complex protein 1 subunit beta [Tanacetum cinerariifolium]
MVEELTALHQAHTWDLVPLRAGKLLLALVGSKRLKPILMGSLNDITLNLLLKIPSIYILSMVAERLFKDEATEEKGERARMASFVGAMAIADLVKTTLGPKGMVKILQSTGRGHTVTVTNDGATILKSLHIDNPAAKSLLLTSQKFQMMMWARGCCCQGKGEGLTRKLNYKGLKMPTSVSILFVTSTALPVMVDIGPTSLLPNRQANRKKILRVYLTALFTMFISFHIQHKCTSQLHV